MTKSVQQGLHQVRVNTVLVNSILTRVGLIRINHLRVRLGLTWLVGELGLYLAISDNNIKHPLEVLVEVELVK